MSCAVCSPLRAALLTGRYQQRFGHEFNSGAIEREAQVGFGLPPSERILPQYLKPAGYRTMAIGKWRLGVPPGSHPLERGFDEFFGFLGGGNAFITKRTPGARAVGADGESANIPDQRADLITSVISARTSAPNSTECRLHHGAWEVLSAAAFKGKRPRQMTCDGVCASRGKFAFRTVAAPQLRSPVPKTDIKDHKSDRASRRLVR